MLRQHPILCSLVVVLIAVMIYAAIRTMIRNAYIPPESGSMPPRTPPYPQDPV